MNSFLRESRKLLKLKEGLCIILGNESCDLDSAISCVSLAYYYEKNRHELPTKKNIVGILPILNIPQEDFPLKTEVVHFFKKNTIDIDSLSFRDEVEENVLLENDVVLVDHHVSPYPKSVVAIFDHRPFDISSNLREECQKTLSQVGSCATLIADLFLKLSNKEDYKDVVKLLYGPIVLDTANFSKKADRARDLDYKIIDEIEKVLSIKESDVEEKRKIEFDDLVHARSDIAGLSSYQILFKDMKMLSSNSGLIKVALPGFPILVQNFIQLENAETNLLKFIEKQNCSVAVLIGMHVTGESLERDIAIVSGNAPRLLEQIIYVLQKSSDPSLELKEYFPNFNITAGRFYSQKNIKASRKQILPIIRSVLSTL